MEGDKVVMGISPVPSLGKTLVTFFMVFPKIIFLLCHHFRWLGWVTWTSESEPSTSCVMNISKKPQTVMPSSLNIELRPISPFRLQHLRRSLSWNKYGRQWQKKLGESCSPVKAGSHDVICVIRFFPQEEGDTSTFRGRGVRAKFASELWILPLF